MRDPIEAGFTIIKSDSADLSKITRGIYVAGTGILRVILADGNEVTFPALAAGIIHEMRVRKVLSTGTTASGIIGLY